MEGSIALMPIWEKSEQRSIQLVQCAVLFAQVVDIRLDVERPARRARQQFRSGEFAAMLVYVLSQPAAQRAEFASGDLRRDLWMRFQSGSVELRAEDIAERVALEYTTDVAAIPVNVLQHAVFVVGRAQAQVGL